MARTVDIALTTSFTPAFYGLLEVAQLLAERWGEERAQEWIGEALAADIELFVRVEAKPRPLLRLLQGGRA